MSYMRAEIKKKLFLKVRKKTENTLNVYYLVNVFVVSVNGIVIRVRLLFPSEEIQQLVSDLEELALLPHHAIALLQLQLLLGQSGLQLLVMPYYLGQAVSQIAVLLLKFDRVEPRLAVLPRLRLKAMLNLGQLVLQHLVSLLPTRSQHELRI